MKIPDELRDFRNFLYLAWKQLNLPDPTPVQYDIADYLQHGGKRKVIQAFRGVGKSWITSAYVVWTLLLDPQKKILVVSASKPRADDFSTFTLRLIHEMPLLRHLAPRPGQRESKIAFDVGPSMAAHAPSVKSVGITGQITGSRANLIIADDVESLQNSDTQVKREKLSETIKEFDAVLVPDDPEASIVFLGTPQTEESVYSVLPNRGYQLRVWPARYPHAKLLPVMEEVLAPFILQRLEKNPDLGRDGGIDGEAGQPTDPDRFDEEDLQERSISYGRSGFAKQFMLDTSLSDAERYPLKLSDLIVTDIDHERAPERLVWARSPELELRDLPNPGFRGDRFYSPLRLVGDMLPFTGSILAVDPSGRGADRTAICVMKVLNGTLYVPEWRGIKGGYSQDALMDIAQTAMKHQVNMVLTESNFGDGMFSALLGPVMRAIYPVAIEEVRHNIQKEARIIDTLEPVMNAHKLVVARKVFEHHDIDDSISPAERVLHDPAYQLTHITRDRGSLKHDDLIDVLAIAAAYWLDAVGLDAETAMRRRQEALHEEEIRRHLEHQVLRQPSHRQVSSQWAR